MEEQNQIWNLITKKLSGEATAEEQQELEAFLKAHPEQQYTFEMLADWWNHPTADTERERSDLHFDQLKAQLALPQEPEENDWTSPRFTGWQKWAAAVAILLLIGWGAFFYLQKNKRSGTADKRGILSQVSTSYGSKSRVILPDGTRVWLNAGSNLTYNNATFGATNRRVTLVGEAYFDVVHNPHIPFVVHAGKINVKVLGTAFDVKSYPEDATTQATLIRGTIEVSLSNRPSQSIRLRPRQTLNVFDNNPTLVHPSTPSSTNTDKQNYHIAPLTRLPNDSTIVETSWMEDKLAFRNESFPELAMKMERWYNVQITFTDTAVKKYRFTGVFINESLEQALKALKITAPFNYRREGDEVYISKKHP